MKDWRRYEILRPLRFNDGKRVPKELLSQTIEELEAHFGAVSCETQIIHGRWRSEGKAIRDDLVRIYVDAENTREAQAFFANFKERTKTRFPQLDIWLTSHSIEVLWGNTQPEVSQRSFAWVSG
ncbi:MAG: hypothetical protein HY735_24405 [Verrucomicrobia bacterium]|nr:hypothetical protein [Verrucomicrobiota bacterium]